MRITADEKTQRLFQRHVLRIADHDLLDRASLEDVQRRYLAGEAVLCVANTVARAQSLFDSLRAALGEESVALLHSRFIGRDRTRKELAIASRVGTGRRIGGGPGTVLCATQVVEVSLDVDFDCVHSDPAPVESLIQRFGRCNRGRRGGLRDVIVHGVLPDRDEVYERADVERTLHILTPHHDRPIEESMVQAWVDAAYDPIAAEWSARLNRKMDEVRAAVVMANRPLDSNDDLRKEFDRLFDGTEVVPARFESEYRRQEREEPLLAPLLRLPITEGQRRRLARTGRIRGEIVDLDYDGDRGLDLSFSDDA